MAHPQNSPRGLFSKQAISVSEGKGVYFEDWAKTTAMLTANSTALQVAAGVRVSGQDKAIITGDARGVLLSGSGVKSSSPSTGIASADRGGAALQFITNSTGYSALAINTSAGRWKYFEVTSLLNTI